MKEITTDNFSFESLRSGNALYVDKTKYVWELVSSETKIYFLSRPRRFGKSLLLSTLKAYFQGRRGLFKGLAIDSLAPEDAWQEWPVIHLDMAQVIASDGLDKLDRSMAFYLGRVAKNLGMTGQGLAASEIFQSLIDYMCEKTGKQVVILIDEYDKPILDALYKPYIEDVVGMMQGFYQVVKSNVDKERFVFITGVTKFAHTSLFSGFNNPTDISQETQFATMLGYTEQELRDNFAEYIELTAQKMNKEREALIDKMKRWYDGFRFTSDSAHVFNPVSVGKFFRNKKFLNYWFSTGTPTFLVKLMRDNPFRLEEFSKEWMSPIVMDRYNALNLDPAALALQTGYITIAEMRITDYGEYYRYDFPNEEIRMSWSDCMLDIVSSNYSSLSAGRIKLDDALRDGDINKIMSLLQSLFAGVTKDHLGNVHEGYYRNMIYMLFTALGVSVHSEEQVAGGRVDIIVEAYSKAYVFELKVSPTADEKQVAAKLAEGIDQIAIKGYAEKYRFNTDSVHAVSVVFENQNHQLVAWREGE